MVQAQTINKILHSKSLDLYWDNDLTVEHFGSNADEMQFILDHYEQYGNVPDIPTFLDKFSEFSECEMHLTHIPTTGDANGLRKLGIRFTYDPNPSSRKLFNY